MLVTQGMLEKLNAMPVLKQLFLQKFLPYYDGENPKFLFAVLHYRRNPRMDEFVRIYHQYVKVDAPDQVNIPASMREPLDVFIATYEKNQTVAATPGPRYEKPLPAPANKFDDSFAEIFRLMNRQLQNSGTDRSHQMFLFLVQNGFLEKAQGA